MDNFEQEKIHPHFKEVNKLFSQLLININNDKMRENEILTDKILDHFNQINQELVEIKKEVTVVLDKKYHQKAQGDIIFPQNTVQKIADFIKNDIKIVQKDIDEQEKVINSCQNHIKFMLDALNNPKKKEMKK